MSITQPSEITTNSHFANSQLAELADFAQVKSRKSSWKSLLYEIYSWLIIPIGIILVLPVAWAFMVATSFFSFVISYLILSFFKVNENLFFNSKFSMFIPLALGVLSGLLGSYLVYREVIVIFFRARRSAKRFRLNNFSQLAKNKKNPILYLRSFNDDKSEEFSRQTLKTYEEDFAFALNSIGPVIAVGKQFDDISPLGATRIYLKTEEWQENVKRLMQISQLVVLNAGTSKSLLWEIETALKEVNPHKILISFLSWQEFDDEFRQVEYQQFKKSIEQIANEAEISPKIIFPDSVENAKFMVFDNEWKPKLLKTNAQDSFFYRFSTSIIIRETLRPALKERDLELSKWRNLAYVIYIFWIITGSIWQLGFIGFSAIKSSKAGAGTYSIFSLVAFWGLAIGIPLLLVHFSTQAAYFIGFNWLLKKFFEFIRFCKEYIFEFVGKIIPSRNSGLQKSIGFNDED